MFRVEGFRVEEAWEEFMFRDLVTVLTLQGSS